METISRLGLFQKTLILMIALFGIIATATSLVSGWNLYRQLTREYHSKGAAIAKSIADFSVPQEILKIRPEVPPRGARELITTTLSIEGLGGVIDIAAPILAGVAGNGHVGMDRNIIRAHIWSAVLRQQGLMFIILLLTALVAYVLVNRISQPLNRLADHAKTLATADLAAGSNIPTEIEALAQRSRDEIGNLAGSFMYMERTLQQYLKNLQETTAAKERIESELKIAHDIQMSMVPKIFPPFPHRREFDVYATLVPAKEVGGDFYDFFFVDEDQLCFAIGDVSGKGVPASLFMAVTKTLLRATASRTGNPDEILSRLNAELCRDNASCMFVTLYTAILEIRSGRLEYSNGGHNLPYHLSNGRIQPLDNTPGMVLGAMEGVKYSTNKMVLQPGDRLLLYTDGVTEAMDERGHLLSGRRLEESLATVKNALPEDLTVALVREVRRFAAGAGQSDDITILALQYWGDDQHARGQDLS